MVCKTRQGKRLTKLAEGGSTSTASSLLGSYTPTVGTTYDESNPYTYGMGAEKVYDFARGSNLITEAPPVNIYDSLSQDAKWYLGKKWGKWANTEEDTGTKGIADTLSDINRIIAYKGGTPSTSNKTQNVEAALAPLVAKRKASGKGFGKILSTVAPIALSVLAPGLGTAVGTALGAGAAFAPAVGGIALGAGTGALTSGLTGGNVLKSALLGGVTGGVGGYLEGVGGLTGLSNGAVKATSGPLAGQWVIPGVMNSATNTATVSNLLNGIPNSVGRLATTGEKILGSIAGTGSNNALSSYGRIANLASEGTSLLGNSAGATQQQGTSSTGGLTQEQLQQLMAYLQQNGARTNSGGILSLVNRASGGSIPETGSSSVGGLQSNRMVVGGGDGMSDSVPAVINGSRPAALSDGEHVVPALQTSLLGRGSSSAGSKRISELIKSEIKDMYGNIDPVKLQTKAMRTNKKGNH